MAKECENNCRLGKVGGEAVLEGVMMRCGERYSIASRKEDGSITVSNHSYTSIRKRNKFFNLPIIRGVVNFVMSMSTGYKCLMRSAEISGLEELEAEMEREKVEKKAKKAAAKAEKKAKKDKGSKNFEILHSYTKLLPLKL